MKIRITKKQIGFKLKRVLSFFWKDREFHITPFVIESGWCIWWQTKKPRMTCNVTYSVNPLPKWKHRIQWRLELWYAKLKDKNAKCCEGCGEGVAEYQIKDPNHRETANVRKWNVCKGCVNFYDMHGSSKSFKEIKKHHVTF